LSLGASQQIIDVMVKWKTGAEVCKILGITRQWLYLLRKEKGIPCRNFGKKTYYEIEAVREHVKRLQKDEE